MCPVSLAIIGVAVALETPGNNTERDKKMLDCAIVDSLRINKFIYGFIKEYNK